MSQVPADRLEISPAAADVRADVLRVVFAHLAREDRASQVADLLKSVERDPRALDGLLTVSLDGRFLGAGLAQMQPGRSAVIWPPPELKTPHAAADALLEALVQFSERNGAIIAQSLLAEDQPGEEMLIRGEFRHISDLAFLFASTERATADGVAAELEFATYSDEHHQRMAAVIERSYVDTLDCPAMNDVRGVEDVLTGYRATGEYSPDRWLIARSQGRDVGCLLLADHPAAGQWELVYMGLTPEARGMGFGAELARRALWMARQAGRQRMVVAVDLANRPALRVYQDAGFVEWTTRRVFLKRLVQESGRRPEAR